MAAALLRRRLLTLMCEPISRLCVAVVLGPTTTEVVDIEVTEHVGC